jgi:dethiobiotin synthetase
MTKSDLLRGFFVAGTDTGVGKTQVARALGALLRERGWSPLALKPVETGGEPDAPDDALALAEACGSNQELNDLCPYRFWMPAAPLVAARAEGRIVELEVIEEIVARAPAPIVVEAAGGLLVPLAVEGERPVVGCDFGQSSRDDHLPTPEELLGEPNARPPEPAILTNLDLAERLGLPVVLVGRAGLGTLNHCALSAAALRARGLEIAAVVLNRVQADDDPSVDTNAEWVGQMTKELVLGPTPFVADARARPGVLAPFVDSLVPRR